MSLFFSHLHKTLQTNQPFTIQNDSSGNPVICPMGFVSRIQHKRDQVFHQERLGKIAAIIAQHLKKLPRENPSITLDNKPIQATRLFLKQAKNQDSRITNCRSELLAYRLGIASSVFQTDLNQGFEQFATNPPLDRYLAAYNHILRVDTRGEVLLRKDDEYIPWSQVKNKVIAPPRDPATNQPWFYGPNGIQNANMFEWTELKPYKKEDPAEWDHKYLFVFCCCCGSKHPNFMGDHSWIEFKTPTGDVYSVGLYRAYKHDPKQNKDNPLRVQKGYLQQPDVSRFWPDTEIHEIPFEITEEKFLEMKQTIEADKKADNLVFQLIGKNCTQYTESIARIAGIELPTQKPFWQLLCKRYGHPLIQKGVEISTFLLPSNINNLLTRSSTFVLSLPLLAAGAHKVDKSLPKEIHPPHFQSWKDAFNPEKLLVKHPYTIGHDTKEYVEKWRAAQIEKLEEELQNAQGDGIQEIRTQITQTRYARIK